MSDVVTIGDATLYHGDCLEILPTLPKVDAVITDPPYGILSASGSAATRRRSNVDGGVMAWDIRPDAVALRVIVEAGDRAAIWGGCHLELGPTFGYLVWDKEIDGLNFGECEFCWTTQTFAPRIFRWRAVGVDGGKVHPTQKPIALMEWCAARLGGDGDVLDPFMGSGTTGVACANLGRKFIGIEIERKYFDIACERIDNAYRQARLFA